MEAGTMKGHFGDVIASLSVAGLLVPECVAYAAIAGLPSQTALIAGIVGGLAYAVAGRSRAMHKTQGFGNFGGGGGGFHMPGGSGGGGGGGGRRRY